MLKPHPLYPNEKPQVTGGYSDKCSVRSESFFMVMKSERFEVAIKEWNDFVDSVGKSSGYWYEESIRAKARADKYEKLATELQQKLNEADGDYWKQEALAARKERTTVSTLRASLQAKEEECSALRTQLNTARADKPVFAIGNTQHSARVQELEKQLAEQKPLGVPFPQVQALKVKIMDLEGQLFRLQQKDRDLDRLVKERTKETESALSTHKKLLNDQVTKNQRLSSELGERATGKWTQEPKELFCGDWLCDFGSWFDVVRVHEGPRGVKGHSDVRHMKIKRAAQLFTGGN